MCVRTVGLSPCQNSEWALTNGYVATGHPPEKAINSRTWPHLYGRLILKFLPPPPTCACRFFSRRSPRVNNAHKSPPRERERESAPIIVVELHTLKLSFCFRLLRLQPVPNGGQCTLCVRRYVKVHWPQKTPRRRRTGPTSSLWLAAAESGGVFVAFFLVSAAVSL